MDDATRKSLYVRFYCAALEGLLARPEAPQSKTETELAMEYAVDSITRFQDVFEHGRTHASSTEAPEPRPDPEPPSPPIDTPAAAKRRGASRSSARPPKR